MSLAALRVGDDVLGEGQLWHVMSRFKRMVRLKIAFDGQDMRLVIRRAAFEGRAGYRLVC